MTASQQRCSGFNWIQMTAGDTWCGSTHNVMIEMFDSVCSWKRNVSLFSIKPRTTQNIYTFSAHRWIICSLVVFCRLGNQQIDFTHEQWTSNTRCATQIDDGAANKMNCGLQLTREHHSSVLCDWWVTYSLLMPAIDVLKYWMKDAWEFDTSTRRHDKTMSPVEYYSNCFAYVI